MSNVDMKKISLRKHFWLQENEHLKKELIECGSKVEVQNSKIAELLQQNQK